MYCSDCGQRFRYPQALTTQDEGILRQKSEPAILTV